jgi:hypothetical protein
MFFHDEAVERRDNRRVGHGFTQSGQTRHVGQVSQVVLACFLQRLTVSLHRTLAFRAGLFALVDRDGVLRCQAFSEPILGIRHVKLYEDILFRDDTSSIHPNLRDNAVDVTGHARLRIGGQRAGDTQPAGNRDDLDRNGLARATQ